MHTDQRTIDTYDKSAQQIAAHFNKYKDGAALKEIGAAFALAPQPVERVVEIGCGAGKEAAELIKRTKHYEGFDPAGKLLDIARAANPAGSFVQADALSYHYPADTTIVFAFASLLHLNKDDFATACRAIAQALTPGGVLCMTLKEADTYGELLQEDDFGSRLFYLYTPELVKQLIGPEFSVANEWHTTAGPQAKRWMSLLFIRRDHRA
jgi:SAM-dependent methyltransferase